MSASHTPGPWNIRTHKLAHGIKFAVFGVSPWAVARVDLEADAHLISAAPDMLSILQRIQAGQEFTPEFCTEIDSVIEKASINNSIPF